MEPSVSLVENLTLTAWPCLHTIHHDGWVLRFADGHTGRANSVNALAPAAADPAALVDFCEQAYAARRLPPQFRITPLCPPDLERELDRRGYRIHNASLVQGGESVVHVGVDAAVRGSALRCIRAPEPWWLDAYRSMVPVPEAEMPALTGILAAIPVPCLYGALFEGERPAAVALAVVDRGWAGLYKVATHPDRRGRGLARQLLAGLLRQAGALGAERAYLQVAAANEPALRLYRALGFRTLYPYHYRLP